MRRFNVYLYLKNRLGSSQHEAREESHACYTVCSHAARCFSWLSYTGRDRWAGPDRLRDSARLHSTRTCTPDADGRYERAGELRTRRDAMRWNGTGRDERLERSHSLPTILSYGPDCTVLACARGKKSRSVRGEREGEAEQLRGAQRSNALEARRRPQYVMKCK